MNKISVAIGHFENTDMNAARVLAKRAIKLLQNSGTELSDKNVLFFTDTGRLTKSTITEHSEVNKSTKNRHFFDFRYTSAFPPFFRRSGVIFMWSESCKEQDF